MKKVLSIMFVLLLLLVVSSDAKMVRKGRPYSCYTSVNLENLRKFQKETLTLRDELLSNKIELEREYSKTKKDYDKITALRKAIVDLQTKIQAVADKYGIRDCGYNCYNCYIGNGSFNYKYRRCW